MLTEEEKAAVAAIDRNVVAVLEWTKKVYDSLREGIEMLQKDHEFLSDLLEREEAQG